MHNYQETKKVRRVAAMIFIIIMTFIVGGSYIAQQEKENRMPQEYQIQMQQKAVISIE
jgi:hypothetical protein